MTTLSVMLNWYAPDTVTLYCDECGREMQSVDGRRRKVLCPDCKELRHRERANIANRERGRVQFTFDDDPETALVFAVIQQAIRDREGQWHAPPQDTEALALAECDPAAFLADGADAWLAALGIGVTQSMRDKLRKAEL